MKWMQERDALIAQTLAFVQSVTGGGKAGEPSTSLVPTPASPPPAAAPAEIVQPTVSVAVEASNIPAPPRRPLVPGDFPSELRGRVASFRAHQERFNREREAYCSATLARARALINEPLPPGPDKRA